MDLLFRISEKDSCFEFFSSCSWFEADRVIGARYGSTNNFDMGHELRHATMLEF